MRIGLVLVWIGILPESFPLFLRSAQQNPTIDFYLVTDQECLWDIPNVHYVKMTLAEIREFFEAELQMKIKLKYSYKLCDYKVLWRLLVPDAMAQYDFWGHYDCDTVLGDVREFLTEELLSNHDKIFDMGSFTLYRNNPKMNDLYKRSIEKNNAAYPYKLAFRTNYACYFDEYMGMNLLAWQYDDIRVFRDQLTENLIQDFGWQTYNFRSYITKESFVFQWKDGKLYRYITDDNGVILENEPPKEYMMAHIQKRSMKIDLDMSEPEDVSEFWIYPNRYSVKRPEGALYDAKQCEEYAELIRKKDKKRRIDNLRRYGIIEYIPHYFITRRIKKFIREKKKFY